ncbi:UNVERIFIED_CONTAM: hypothetical protein PYX00_011444 [Menopon gallinae]|uniref:Uncharacterized protein n=1 Tax=Menopon gallinae TaxID=328185 RepID=A0AAW2H7P4_9NEOP
MHRFSKTALLLELHIRAIGHKAHCCCDQLDPAQAMQVACERETPPGRGVQLQGRGQKANAGCRWALSSLQYAHLHNNVFHTQSADAPRPQAPLVLLAHKHPLQIHPDHQASPRNGRLIARCMSREAPQKGFKPENYNKAVSRKKVIKNKNEKQPHPMLARKMMWIAMVQWINEVASATAYRGHEEVFDYTDLQKLDLSFNQLIRLPKEIGSLSQLQELDLSGNRLTRLPKEIGHNELTTLPGEIGSLSQLQKLSLSCNELTTLPGEIGSLSQLKWLYLYDNQLTTLPRKIATLQSIIQLDLRNNPLTEYGEGDTLGWRELRDVFGGRVVLDKDKAFREEEVYKRLAASSPHWNITRLRTIMLERVPESKHSAKEILDIWRNKLARYAPVCTDGGDMESYIKTLWGTDKEAFKGWRMYDSSVQATRDLVEAVVLKLRKSRVDAEAYVPELCEALLYCPDRQMATLNMMYSALYAKRDAGSFEYFVENEIATLKRYILDIVVTPGLGTQNVHVQNYWRYKLREKLGFKEEYKPRMGMFGQDLFGGHVGNVLDVFYTKFTPEYVVERLVEEINGRKERLMEAGAYLSGRLKDESYKRRVFEFENEEDADLLIPSRITHSGVEDILEGMGILVRGGEETSDAGSPVTERDRENPRQSLDGCRERQAMERKALPTREAKGGPRIPDHQVQHVVAHVTQARDGAACARGRTRQGRRSVLRTRVPDRRAP